MVISVPQDTNRDKDWKITYSRGNALSALKYQQGYCGLVAFVAEETVGAGGGIIREHVEWISWKMKFEDIIPPEF